MPKKGYCGCGCVPPGKTVKPDTKAKKTKTPKKKTG